jgi:hypothetical protein
MLSATCSRVAAQVRGGKLVWLQSVGAAQRMRPAHHEDAEQSQGKTQRLPPTVGVQPIVGVGMGVGLLSDHLRLSPVALTLQNASMAARSAAIRSLGAAPMVRTTLVFALLSQSPNWTLKSAGEHARLWATCATPSTVISIDSSITCGAQ